MFLLLLAGFAFGTEITQNQILEKHSLEKLDSAANLLRVVADGTKLCGMDSKKASNYLLAIHPLIDSKIKATASNPKRVNEIAKLAPQCQLTCHCGVYEDVMNQNPTSATQRKAIEFKNKAALLSSKSALKCAKKNLWFCKSELASYLDREYQGSYKP